MAMPLEVLQDQVSHCQRCGLRQGCRQTVFGEGNVNARIVLIGEGPGAMEDMTGRPFVGAAGQLLDKILAACEWDRFAHTYVLNVVKCRPPGNRTPTPQEREACRPYLDAQLQILQPAIVVLLGATAVQALIGPKARVTQLRGQWLQKDGVWYMPTYHPAALLRDPAKKKETWHDFQLVIAKYHELVN